MRKKNGVDVGNFITAIAMRQFGKASTSSRSLKALQLSVIAPRDELTDFVLTQLRAGMAKFLRNRPVPDLQDLEIVSRSPLSVFLKQGSDAARFASQNGIADLHSVQREFERDRFPRQRISCIIRALPQQIARLIRASQLLNAEPRFSLVTNIDCYELPSTKSIKLSSVYAKVSKPSSRS